MEYASGSERWSQEIFGRGVAGQERVAGQVEHGVEAAELAGQPGAVGLGGGVVPELGGADGAVCRRPGDHAVLLAGDADADDFDGAGLEAFEGLAGGGLEGGDPPVRVLLAGAVVLGDEVVGGAAERERHEGVGVQEQGFGGLGAAVDPEEGPSRHGEILRRPGCGLGRG